MILVILTILLVGIKGSFAQIEEDRSCLVKIGDCLEESVTSTILDCCPIIKDTIVDERECFCLTKEIFGRNASHAKAWSNILIFCSVTASIDSLCPDSNSSPVVPASSSPEESPELSPDTSPTAPSTDEFTPTESPISTPIGDDLTPSSPTDDEDPPTSPTIEDPPSSPTIEEPPSSPTDELLFPPETPEQPATDDNNDPSHHGSGDEKKDGNKDTSIGGGSNAKKIGYPMFLLSSSALFIWAIL